MKKNLLELCLSPDLGGLELYMVRCAKALDDDFNVISVINPRGKLGQYYGGTPYRCESVEKKSNLLMFGAAKKLSRIIDDNDIDIIHMHWTKDIPVAVLAKKLSRKKPKIVQTRNMTMTRFKDDFYHRGLYRNIDLMLPVTHQVAEQIRRFIPESVRPKVEVLYMGSDKPELLNDEEIRALRSELGMDEHFAVGLVGRIEETKGQHLLIDALSVLRQSGCDVEAFFVGHAMKEGYIETLQQRADGLGVGEAVHFPGFMKNPHHFMQACDCIVLATECETFGLVLIEAMQVGTTVIGSNRGGVLEIIDDGETGLLFESQNSGDLARRLEQLCRSRELLQKLSYAGEEKARKLFSNETQFRALSRVMASL